MGGCCSCCISNDESPSSSLHSNASHGNSQKETELTSQNSALCIDGKYSSDGVIISRDCINEISGSGLALGSVSIEQDSAYWEVHINKSGDEGGNNDDNNNFSNDGFEALQFGVSKRPPRNNPLRTILERQDDVCYVRAIPNLGDGDVVGIAVQQSDLPMVQFLVNGEPLHHMAINRFRGIMYPAAVLCGSHTLKFVFNEEEWKEKPPHPKFGAMIVARGII